MNITKDLKKLVSKEEDINLKNKKTDINQLPAKLNSECSSLTRSIFLLFLNKEVRYLTTPTTRKGVKGKEDINSMMINQ